MPADQYALSSRTAYRGDAHRCILTSESDGRNKAFAHQQSARAAARHGGVADSPHRVDRLAAWLCHCAAIAHGLAGHSAGWREFVVSVAPAPATQGIRQIVVGCLRKQP